MLVAAATKSYQTCVVQILVAVGNPAGKVKKTISTLELWRLLTVSCVISWEETWQAESSSLPMPFRMKFLGGLQKGKRGWQRLLTLLLFSQEILRDRVCSVMTSCLTHSPTPLHSTLKHNGDAQMQTYKLS